MANILYDTFFKLTHANKLIYNTCWEDPRADRAMLQIDSNSRMAVITSAGCNVLDYLLDNPAEIHAIDLNFRQNALLELKMVAIATLEHADFFQLFGQGQHLKIDALYHSMLRPCLSPSAAKFWDRHIHFFSSTSKRQSFYFYGTSGDVAWGFNRAIKFINPKLHAKIIRIINAANKAEQQAIYPEVEAGLFGPLLRWVVRQPVLLSLLGVPRAQRDLIEQQFEGGVTEFIQQKLRHVFTQTSMAENYFWRVYLTGKYTEDCCPNYLKKTNFDQLKQRIGRIKLHTCSVEEFLGRRTSRHTLTHFVLLDHQDWMAAHMPDQLLSEWQHIIENAAAGCKVLLRSAAINVDFLPEYATHRSIQNKVLANHWQQLDRVGTYGATWLAEIPFLQLQSNDFARESADDYPWAFAVRVV